MNSNIFYYALEWVECVTKYFIFYRYIIDYTTLYTIYYLKVKTKNKLCIVGRYFEHNSVLT